MARRASAGFGFLLIASLAATGAAQGNVPRATPSPRYVIVDGERLSDIPGLLDSLRSGRFTVDSTVTPARLRISAQGAAGGAVFFPIETNIESVEVLKGKRAVDLYGADAANGVIIVSTKQPSVVRR